MTACRDIDLTAGPISPIALSVSTEPIAISLAEDPIELTTSPSPVNIAITQDPIQIAILGIGAQGPKGDSGVGSGPAFTFTQNTPSAGWVVYHGLGRKPSITIIKSTNEITFGHVTYPNDDSAIVQFSAAISGTALCY